MLDPLKKVDRRKQWVNIGDAICPYCKTGIFYRFYSYARLPDFRRDAHGRPWEIALFHKGTRAGCDSKISYYVGQGIGPGIEAEALLAHFGWRL